MLAARSWVVSRRRRSGMSSLVEQPRDYHAVHDRIAGDFDGIGRAEEVGPARVLDERQPAVEDGERHGEPPPRLEPARTRAGQDRGEAAEDDRMQDAADELAGGNDAAAGHDE